MNGYGLSNYDTAPKGWDWADVLVCEESGIAVHTQYSNIK